MSMNTYLKGRLRNTTLHRNQGLMPLFEAVVNSIHSIAEISNDPTYGRINIEILRESQGNLAFENGKAKRGAPPQEPIVGFKISDNGSGFNDRNMASFETLDSDYKAGQGCRGVGRLLWLKAFEAVNVHSVFTATEGQASSCTFTFTASQGVGNKVFLDVKPNSNPITTVHLTGFERAYREASPKTATTIANSLFEHCLWYFVRDGGAPKILLKDGFEQIDLEDVYNEYMQSSSTKEEIKLKDQIFEVTHLRLKVGPDRQHFIAWCAASRVVYKENLSGKIPGLHGKIKDDAGDFFYACYVTSPFLDERVRPERIGFDIVETSDDLFSDSELDLNAIRSSIVSASKANLKDYLDANERSSRERVDKFISLRAPRYRPILGRIDPRKLNVDPEISDRDLDLLLHKQLAEIEGSLISEGHEVMNFGISETPAQYQNRLQKYLGKVDDIKKSDLANYVFHRKIILDILEKSIAIGPDGRYAREDLIHEIIMPMQKTSDEITSDNSNLWLIDERLAFHNFLASDKTLSSLPITGNTENCEPDICALNVFDEPLLVSDGIKLPLASIVVVEIKRPMRNDAAAGEKKDPIEQALGYLERIREGGAKTARGREIPGSQTIPGFCYVISDLTPTVRSRCKYHNLRVTSDNQGYFGYNDNFKAYIEVSSFDRILNAARERNRAFFDKLGLPTN
ncbi:Uncharacterised protein [Delftia tsuruhatensis]|uniref:DUF4263 domain-containing protein n=1 Tax=Delftia tsuruhatensis TaxID=180282 RepID=UPI001E7C65DF|nr:DUF4263 domain-containing protein [Delftia tsuruhatensis]CAB5706957.1 Uncharacterised protein [Delftia tsuruhatensis]CAC9684715.1 Uncharacterised protein [Delftia tsuruhatensis]